MPAKKKYRHTLTQFQAKPQQSKSNTEARARPTTLLNDQING